MYPTMRAEAIVEGNQEAEREAAHQIAESHTHAQEFRKILIKADKRFNALQKVEERHANAYKKILETL